MSSNHPGRDDRDFQQFSNAFDRPVAPSPSFAEALRRQVNTARAHRVTTERRPAPIVSIPAAPSSTPWRPRRIGGRVLEIAAAVLLVTTLALSAFFVYALRNDGSSNDDRDNVAALASPGATPTASASQVDHPQVLRRVNGPAWYFPDPAFDATSFRISTLVDDQRYTIRSIQVYGNYLVQAGSFFEGDYGDTHYSLLWVTDVATGHVLWETREHFIPNIAISNDMIYGIQVATNGDQPISKLVGMSLTTGERAFSDLVLPVAEGPEGEGMGPVVVGDVVYVADSTGTVFASDAFTGEQRWVSEGEKRATPAPNGLMFSAGGSLVAEPGAIYVMTGDNRIRKLDPEDGTIRMDVDIAAETGLDISQVTLYHTGEHLIARINGLVTIRPDIGAMQQMIPETIVSIDSSLGDVRWVEAFPDIAGNIVVTPDSVMIPTREAPADAIVVRVLNAEDGATTQDLFVSDARTVSVTATDTDGGTLIMVDSDGLLQVGQDANHPEFMVVHDANIRSVPGEGSVPPAVISNGKAFIANEAGRIIVLRPDE